MSTRPNPSPAPGNSLPLQFAPFTEEHFKTPEGIAFFNQQWQQMIIALNANTGTGGKVILPQGIDVRGATVSGVGSPKSPSDAISSGHADSQFSAPVLSPKLDIGGSSALKGLTGLYLQLQQLLEAGSTGTVTLAKITGGGANGSLTFKQGSITGFVAPT